MEQILSYILLGALQGATEFLPISSSGHLVAAQALLGVESEGMLLEVSLHFGTLIAILFVFRRDIVQLLRHFWRGTLICVRRGGIEALREDAPLFLTALAIVLGTVPAAAAGLLLHDQIEGFFSGDLRLTGVLLMLTGLVLTAGYFIPQGDSENVGPLRGLCVGLAQALALLPGISRSGITIVMGYLVGLERRIAARFSFLLVIPALIGAMGLELVRTSGEGGKGNLQLPPDAFALLCGMVTSAAVGGICLVLLLKVVQKRKLHWFAVYCLPLGAALVAIGFLR